MDRVLLAGCALCAVVTGALVLPGTWREQPAYAVATVVVTSALLLTGAGLVRSRRGHRTARWIMAAAAAWPAYWADVGQAGWAPFSSWVAENLVWCLFGMAFLAFPDELAPTRRERVFMRAVWVSVAVGAVALTLLSRPEWLGFPAAAHWPGPWADRAASEVALGVFALGRVVLAVTGTRLVLARLRKASDLDRSVVLRPAFCGLLLSIVVVVVTGLVQEATTDQDVNAVAKLAQGLSLLFLPAVLLAGWARTRMVRAEMVDRVMRQPRPTTAESVRDALREALHDDSVEVLVEPGPDGAEGAGLRPGDGQPADHRYRVPVTGSDGRRIAVVSCDPRLRSQGHLVQTAARVAGLELENVVLHRGLLDQMEELRRSRDRLVRAGQAERRRLERDLHDGAQQHMLAMALTIEHARLRSQEPEVQQLLQHIKDEMRGALTEIRDLARGIQPGTLVQAGLGPALQALTDGMPLPVRLEVPVQRWPQQAETAAYFVASEALSNIVKHAGAHRAAVTVHQHDGRLMVTVTDDGTGDVRMQGGSGLRGLADRVQALGGRVEVSGSPEAGSRVEAEIPCG
jgi:signal transduction histidine kinase